MKIAITETQLNSVKKLMNEQNNGKEFTDNVKLHFYAYDVTKDGHEIEVIDPIKSEIYFNIEVEKKSWGYRNFMVHSISGPQLINIEIEYFEGDSDESTSTTIEVPMNWENVRIETKRGNGIIGIDDNVEVFLKNDESGNIVVDYIELTVLDFKYEED